MITIPISSHCASAHRPEPAFQNRRTESRSRPVAITMVLLSLDWIWIVSTGLDGAVG